MIRVIQTARPRYSRDGEPVTRYRIATDAEVQRRWPATHSYDCCGHYYYHTATWARIPYSNEIVIRQGSSQNV